LPNSRNKRALGSDDVLAYREYMSLVSGPIAGAAARTAAAGTARLFAAWSTGSPLPEAADRRCEGVADLAARRASVSQSPFMTDGVTAALTGQHDDDPGAPEPPGDTEMIYDGANAYIRVGGRWTGFFLADPGGPRGPNDPLWPLDALFGANGDAAEIGPEAVRGVPATRYRLTVDLARADAALPAGVSVPSGPYRSLGALPAEVWLDAAGLARRISVCSDPGAGDAQVWSIVELWDFGVAADITPPGPGEVLAPAEAYRLAEDGPPGRDA
jgi:hypothetical protein